MKEQYVKAMDKLFMVCMWGAGLCLLVMTMVIPLNVFMRYVMDAAMSWPEPLSVVLMIVFTFIAASVCYRANMHISVMLLVNVTQGWRRTALGWITEITMIGFNLFVLYYGTLLAQAVWHDYLAEFTAVRVGITYMPIPIGAFITFLFIVERVWTRAFFPLAADATLPASGD
jgi:TRAP-type C4-dicarboxylate transport system permease small subunit